MRMQLKDIPTMTSEQCLHEILDVLTCIRNGHFTCYSAEEMPGDAGKIAKVINELLGLMQVFRREHNRLVEEIGVTGRLGGQVELPDCTGAWREMADALNRLGVNMTCQQRDACNVVTDQLRGNPQSRMTARFIAGEFREFRDLFNELLDRVESKSMTG
jgi:hypothetical protein